jgi:alkanesulfonate monooxygenase SsuD/methylene tetrahydromethanopterin reductase-like flavin-dependent oxidoreductase (luciferase family)
VTVPVGVVLVDEPRPGGWASLGPVAAELEAAGADAVWLTDHLFWHGSAVDVIGGLHAVAAATRTCTIGPCVLQLPLRHVASTAKSLGYLASLAPDRLVVGVGVGEHEAEYRAAQMLHRFDRRGPLLDAGIDELRRLLAGEVDADGLALTPAAPLPIWVGGRSHHARRRAARRGDGWIPHLCRADWFAEQMPLLDADLAAEGRSTDAIARAAVVAVAVDGIEPEVDPCAWLGRLYDLPPKAFERVVARGSAAQIAEELEAFEASGATHLTLVIAGDRQADHLAAVLAARGR